MTQPLTEIPIQHFSFFPVKPNNKKVKSNLSFLHSRMGDLSVKFQPLSKKKKKMLTPNLVNYFDSEEELAKFLKDTEIFEMTDKTRNLHYLLDKNQKVIFFKLENKWTPSLHLIMKKQLNIPSVMVDEGAVRFILNGADIFGQGIIQVDKRIKEDDVLVIKNPQQTSIAVGIALVSAPDMKKGRVIKNIHRIGDKIYTFTRS